MRGPLLLMLAGLVAFGADDEWTKVRSLKTGAELRVYKKGSTQPVSAQMDELTDENLVVDADGKENTSTSTGYSFGGKPNFETIYRRPPGGAIP
jgi:hypothetical protein